MTSTKGPIGIYKVVYINTHSIEIRLRNWLNLGAGADEQLVGIMPLMLMLQEGKVRMVKQGAVEVMVCWRGCLNLEIPRQVLLWSLYCQLLAEMVIAVMGNMCV